MIKKDEFLEWPQVELTIGSEFKCYRCHPIGLTRSVDSKSVRFTLRHAHHGVEKRRGEKKQCAENQREQRKPGWIGNTAHTPFLAPASDSCIKQNSGKCESDEDKDAQVGQQLCAVIQNIMTDLVRHHRADFRQRALLEQIIV